MTQKSISSMNLGRNLVIGGLIVQIVFFGFFMMVGLIFNI